MRILMVGDTHANLDWLGHVRRTIDRTRPDLVVQVGDFGFWPRMGAGRSFLQAVDQIAHLTDAGWWFVDGNHEDHEALNDLPVDPGTGRRKVAEHVWHLPRGHRENLDGLDWLFLGGAVSVDADSRLLGIDWFDTEAPSRADLERAIAGGPAHVVVAHDIPWGSDEWTDRLRQDLPPHERHVPWPVRWLTASDECEQGLRMVLDTVRPAVWFHGHHHARVSTTLGSTRLEGLSRDGDSSSLLLVDETGRPIR